MAKRIFGLFLAACLGCANASGQTNRYGLGIVVFEPTGLTGKVWLNKSSALDAAIGWSTLPGHHLHLHADYLFYEYRFHSDSQVDFSFYLGAGGKVIFQEHDNAWFRVPLGIDFLSKKSPLNIFFEVVPSFNFSELDLVGAIGVRYTFTP
ncbi:MAG: hypothetical protein FJY81_01685 [Candidatus Aminicenantes bacterium]|nr:hypothetical protein [Candidatus Aminicenantes bacterium]